MEFAAICLRNALLLLPEEQQDPKQENGSKNSSQLGGNPESSESSETCRYSDPCEPLRDFISKPLCPLGAPLQSAAWTSKSLCLNNKKGKYECLSISGREKQVKAKSGENLEREKWKVIAFQ